MKFPGVKALTFDVGGTVFDWRGAIESEIQRLSDEKGVEVDARQFATATRGKPAIAPGCQEPSAPA